MAGLRYVDRGLDPSAITWAGRVIERRKAPGAVARIGEAKCFV